MEVSEAMTEVFSARQLAHGVILCAFLQYYAHPHRSFMQVGAPWTAYAISFASLYPVYILGSIWLALVNKLVPEPYLDEFFHIPQAQKYCQGRFGDWDDKITTPPGLYLVSWVLQQAQSDLNCSSRELRAVNLPAVLFTCIAAYVGRRAIEATGRGRSDCPLQAFSLYGHHTAINIALFPALFFFSALFYTDVVSTLMVLVAYNHHLSRISGTPGVWSGIWAVTLGVGTLFMRQTNVFWVVVFMGAQEAVYAVRSLKLGQAGKKPVDCNTFLGVLQHYASEYSLGHVHDPPLALAYPDDYLVCAISYAIAAIANPMVVIQRVWPHVTLLGLFASFVAWNGSVVLGDKSNHVATIHLAQMLYIWPLFAFFSAPLLVSSLLEAPTKIWQMLATQRGSSVSGQTAIKADDSKAISHGTDKSIALRFAEGLVGKKRYYLPYLAGTMALSVAIVHFNTIVHPFTLADNRHYMFYVFRYTIRRSTVVRYGLVGAYTISRWLVWDRMAGSSSEQDLSLSDVPYINTPFPSDTMQQAKERTKASPEKQQPPLQAQQPFTTELGLLDESSSASHASPATSTALFWLLTTALSLITAPLVEPRYFILPWVFWRLQVPAWNPRRGPTWLRRFETFPLLGGLFRLAATMDLTLVLETGWFLAVNVVTMFVFLFRPYEWIAEDGRVLDGGRLQRFMW